MSLPGEGLFALLQKSGIVPRSIAGADDPGNQFVRFLEDAYSSNRSFRKKFIKFISENETAKNIAGYSIGVNPDTLAAAGNAYESIKDAITDGGVQAAAERGPYVNSVVYPA